MESGERGKEYRAVLVHALLPAAMMSLAYYLFLGQRRDYLGHFAAGYGGTLIAIVLAWMVLPQGILEKLRGELVFLVTLFCIALGGLAEATVFRLALFDMVDFFNQSLGAVLAGLSALALAIVAGRQQTGARTGRLTDGALRIALGSGIFHLLLGGYFAVT